MPCLRARLAWNVGTDQAPAGDEVAHFLVPAAHMWDDVVHTCAHQRLFCAPGCVDQWLQATGNPKGYVMDLSTLWRFASDWYTGSSTPATSAANPAKPRTTCAASASKDRSGASDEELHRGPTPRPFAAKRPSTTRCFTTSMVATVVGRSPVSSHLA